MSRTRQITERHHRPRRQWGRLPRILLGVFFALLLLVSLLPLAGRVINIGVVAPAAASALGLAACVWTPFFRRILQYIWQRKGLRVILIVLMALVAILLVWFIVVSVMMLRGAAYARQLVEDFEALLRRKGTDADALVGRTADGIVTYQNLGSLHRRQVEVQTELCAGCQGTPCVTTCYFGGMTRENGQPVHHPEACSGCGLCAHSCGRGAVRIRESNE